MKRPLVVYAGQGLSLADGFNLTNELRWLKGHCFVEVDDPRNLDRVLYVLRERLSQEDHERRSGYLYEVLLTIDRLCGIQAYVQRQPRLLTTRRLCQRLSDIAADRLVVLFTSNLDCVARYEAVEAGATWLLGRKTTGIKDWKEIATWLSTIASRKPGFHYFPVHGEAGLVARGDGGTTYATTDVAMTERSARHPWGRTAGEGLGRNVTMIEQRMHVSQAGYRLLRALVGGTSFDPTQHNEVATDPKFGPETLWPLIQPKHATAAHLMLVGYGAGHLMEGRQYPLELSLEFVFRSVRAFSSGAQWRAIVGPDREGLDWLSRYGFSVATTGGGETNSCWARLSSALDELGTLS